MALLSEDKERNAFGLRIVGRQVTAGDAGESEKGLYEQVGGCKPRKLKTGDVTIK